MRANRGGDVPGGSGGGLGLADAAGLIGLAVAEHGDQQPVAVVGDDADAVDHPSRFDREPAVLDYRAAVRVGGAGDAPVLAGLDVAHQAERVGPVSRAPARRASTSPM